MFGEKKQRTIHTNKLSKYYDEISRNMRSDQNSIQKFKSALYQNVDDA